MNDVESMSVQPTRKYPIQPGIPELLVRKLRVTVNGPDLYAFDIDALKFVVGALLPGQGMEDGYAVPASLEGLRKPEYVKLRTSSVQRRKHVNNKANSQQFCYSHVNIPGYSDRRR